MLPMLFSNKGNLLIDVSSRLYKQNTATYGSNVDGVNSKEVLACVTVGVTVGAQKVQTLLYVFIPSLEM